MPKLKVLCDCGKPGLKKRINGARICADCRALENKHRELKGKYADNGRVAVRCYVPREKNTQNFQDFLDTTPIIAHESIARLERMLLTVTQPQV